MKKIQKRSVSMLLAVIVSLLMLPGMALAADNIVATAGSQGFASLKEAVDYAATNSCNVELQKNVTEDITLDAPITIEGRGYTIDGTMTLKQGTLQNLTLTSNGKQLLTVGSSNDTKIVMKNVTVKYPLVEKPKTISHVAAGNQADILIDGCLFTNDADNGSVTLQAPQWSYGLYVNEQGQNGRFTFQNSKFNGAFRTMLPSINGNVTIQNSTFVNEVYSVNSGSTSGSGEEASCITTARTPSNLIIRNNVFDNAGVIYLQRIPSEMSGNTIKFDVFEHYVQASGSAGGEVDLSNNTFSVGGNSLIAIDTVQAPIKLPAGQMAVNYWPWAETDEAIRPEDYSSYKYAYNKDGSRTFYPETAAALQAFMNPKPGNLGAAHQEKVVIAESMTIDATTAFDLAQGKDITIEIPKGHTLTLAGRDSLSIKGNIQFTGAGKLVISEGATLNVAQGATVAVETAVENNGDIQNNGSIAFAKPITGSGIITGSGTYRAPAPASAVPQTGDGSPLALWFALMTASVLGMAGITVQKRKTAR